MIARIIQEIHPKGLKLREQLQRQAIRIAVNRTIAGVHFPVDSAAGEVLGNALAEYFLSRCGYLSQVSPRRFDGREYGGAEDFPSFADSNQWSRQSKPIAADANSSMTMRWLRDQVAAEWPRAPGATK